MALFQPMHGAAIQAAPIPTALICTVCTLAWYGVVTVNWKRGLNAGMLCPNRGKNGTCCGF